MCGLGHCVSLCVTCSVIACLDDVARSSLLSATSDASVAAAKCWSSATGHRRDDPASPSPKAKTRLASRAADDRHPREVGHTFGTPNREPDVG